MAGRLANIHFLEEEEDDLYAGFEDYDASKDVEALENDESLREAVKTSYGQRPHMAGRPPATGRKPPVPGTSLAGRMKTGAGRPITGLQAADSSAPRPMTSVRGAGFTSHGKEGSKLNASTGYGATMEKKPEDTPEEQLKVSERKVNDLVEESAKALAAGNMKEALTKAKDAGRLERNVTKQREALGGGIENNMDLTYWVIFNLSTVYYSCKMYTQALNSYMVIVRNKTYSTAGRLRLNMGNIYFEQGNYTQAMKMYRMALDKFSASHQMMRMKVLQNIATVLIKTGRYADAVNHLEVIMTEGASFKSALNLILCYYALGDSEKMKQTFLQMLQINMGISEEDRYLIDNDADHHTVMVHDAIKDDGLRRYEEEKKRNTEHCIVTAAKVMAPALESTFAAGFDWCVEAVRSSVYQNLVSDLEVTKAVTYLKIKDHRKAIETLKDFEKKDSKLTTAAATNLSFLLFLDGDTAQAENYADKAIEADHYNPAALVNKGNCSFVLEDFAKARDYYLDAISVEAACTEALYNLGLAYKKLGNFKEACVNFVKLNSILAGNSQVLYQIGDLHDKQGERQEAIKWFTELQTLVPTDPMLLTRLGRMYEEDNDKSMAFQCFQEASRYYPCDIDVISWLGSFYVESGTYERAMPFFANAAALQPDVVRWQLMVASCLRRSGNYQEALDHYKATHQRFPDNVDCLKYLARVTADMNLEESQDYAEQLRRAQKMEEKKLQRAQKGERSGKKRDDEDEEDRPRRPSGSTTAVVNETVKSSRRRRQEMDDDNDDVDLPAPKETQPNKAIDASYSDPLQGLPERPKTAARRANPADDDGFGDDDLDDTLLPE
ncbi:intraflagellar transport protein 88 homolog [Sycon ciliatum]|uniref:intraflagellar transport protein 88 homolog n=1 Tax=Sycon ciliatum TaxID=27933 RepID=UPI0031F6DA33